MADVRHSRQVECRAPCKRAMPYMITPAMKNRLPAISNGGMD
jgi:hypothetical protein